jgi:hypothetical protein
MEHFQESIKDMEKANLIERSNSPWSSPIHIVRKDGGAIRITQEYKLKFRYYKRCLSIAKHKEHVEQISRS